MTFRMGLVEGWTVMRPIRGFPDQSLYIGGYEGQGMEEMKINAMDNLLKKDAPAGFEWVVKRVLSVTGRILSKIRPP